MKARNSHIHCVGVLIGLVLFVFANSAPASAQVGATTWDKPQQVKRVAKPKRVYKVARKPVRRPTVQLAPLLTVQYRVLIKRPDGTEGESSVASVFHPGDQLRLAVTANQNGFLYIVYQKEGEDGVIQFPDSRVNNGENYVAKNLEFVLPPINCPSPDPSDCWYKVTNDPQKEFFIIVFSRDQILDLPNGPDAAEEVKQAFASGVLKKSVIDYYMKTARIQDYKIYSRPANSRSPGSRYAIWVTNMNRADNEEIIMRVPLNKAV